MLALMTHDQFPVSFLIFVNSTQRFVTGLIKIDQEAALIQQKTWLMISEISISILNFMIVSQFW